MSKETLKKQALELSQKERAQLAHFLIDSLNPDSEFKSQEAWSKELKIELLSMKMEKVQQNLGAKLNETPKISLINEQ